MITETIPKEALKCRKCGKESSKLKSDGGRRNWCVECIRAYYAEYRKTHHENYAQRMREWRKQNRDKVRAYSKKHAPKVRKAYWDNPEQYRKEAIQKRRRLKDLVYAAYGGYSCRCCGETTPEFLTIDHINGDGANHRRIIGRCGNTLLLWLKKNNFPTGFQILCWNCQWGKRRDGICPHQRTSND
jgi:hypothetical protein